MLLNGFQILIDQAVQAQYLYYKQVRTLKVEYIFLLMNTENDLKIEINFIVNCYDQLLSRS